MYPFHHRSGIFSIYLCWSLSDPEVVTFGKAGWTCSTSCRTSTSFTKCYNHFRIIQQPAQILCWKFLSVGERPTCVTESFNGDKPDKVNFSLFYSILLNIMFHALTGGFQLELFIFIIYFSTRHPTHKLCFLSCNPFVVNATFSTGLVILLSPGLGSWQLEFKSVIILKFILLLGLGCWSWSSNHWCGEKFVHWVILSCYDLNSNCQLPKPGDRRNYKICWKCRVNDERPTGKKTQLVIGMAVEK